MDEELLSELLNQLATYITNIQTRNQLLEMKIKISQPQEFETQQIADFISIQNITQEILSNNDSSNFAKINSILSEILISRNLTNTTLKELYEEYNPEKIIDKIVEFKTKLETQIPQTNPSENKARSAKNLEELLKSL